MRQLPKLITALTILFFCTGMVNSQKTKKLDDCKVVGKVVTQGSDQIISVDQSLIKDDIQMPLSALTEELQIIRLDNKEDALVANTGVMISDNYILVHGRQQTPFKLFDKKGNFLTAIGAFGQGPGEYQNVYDVQIDEANDRIYLLPWMAQQLLSYDLKGNFIGTVPMPDNVPKGKFKINKNGTMGVVLLPFEDKYAVAWTQELEMKEAPKPIRPGHLTLPRDFSNEVYSGRNTDAFDVNILCIMPTPRADSLYHFDMNELRLKPVFTVKFLEDPIPWHGYSELPNHFGGDTSVPEKISATTTVGTQRKHYLVDKKTLKGAYVDYVNDFLGNISMYPSFSNGYYTANYEPGSLIEEIEKALEKKSLSKEMRNKLTKLKASINENDNNYILYAKIKK